MRGVPPSNADAGKSSNAATGSKLVIGEEERRRKALAAATAPAETAVAAAALAEAEKRAESCRVALEAGLREIAALHPQEAAAVDAARRTAARLSRLEAEAAALDAVLTPATDTGNSVPVLSALRVAEGFEAAVGAAFEDELSAPFAEGDGASAGQFWVDLGAIDSLPALPDGVRALAEVVSAPPELGRSLAGAGWVEDAAAGRNLQRNLAPGQRLVGRDGGLWRWDGFTRLAANPSAAAQHLRHKNRLLLARRRNHRGGGGGPRGRDRGRHGDGGTAGCGRSRPARPLAAA